MALAMIHRAGTAIAAIALMAAMHPIQLSAQQITLLHVNDTHSHIVAGGAKDTNLDGTVGGLPKVATIINAQKALDPQALFVHAGDFMDGDLFFNQYYGVPELQLLRSLKLDAIVPGNHEFFYGPDFLAGVLGAAWPGGAADVPVLATNVTSCPAIAPWNAGTLIKDVNGVKVGLFGLTIRSPSSLSKPAPCVIQSSLTAAAQAAVTSLQAQGAQIVVALSHAGMDQARTLAAAVPGIDVIVNGHDNALLQQPETISWPGGTGVTRIVSAGRHYGWVGRLRLSFTGSVVGFIDYALIPVDATVAPDPTVQAGIDALKVNIVANYGDVYHTPLTWARDEIAPTWNPRHARRDTPLGNLITDAYRAWTGTDIAIEAMGFLEDALPRGWIVGADVFRAMPYGPITDGVNTVPQPWRLVTFKVTGDALVSIALERTIGLGGNSFPQISGMRLGYDSRLPIFNRILRETVHVGGPKLVGNKLYSVTVTEGVFGALVGLKLPMEDVRTLTVSAFDAARAFVDTQKKLRAEGSRRIRDVAVLDDRD